MPGFPNAKARPSKRVVLKLRGSLIISLDRMQERFPRLVLDSSKDGFRLRGSFHLRPGQVVEIILDEDSLNSVRYNAVWTGKARSKYEGEVGLETAQPLY